MCRGKEQKILFLEKDIGISNQQKGLLIEKFEELEEELLQSKSKYFESLNKNGTLESTIFETNKEKQQLESAALHKDARIAELMEQLCKVRVMCKPVWF